MNSSEQKTLRTKVHKALEPFYKSNGFTLNKNNGIFKKDGLEVEWGVSAKNVDYIYFTPTLCVSSNDINNSLHAALTGKKFGHTICQLAGYRLAQEFCVHEYDYLGDNEDNVDNGTTYKVNQETNFDPIIADHVNYMEKVGFPFFEKVSSLEGIYEYLSGILFKKENANKIIGKREILSCLAAAYLLRSSNIESLLKKLEDLYVGSRYIYSDVQKIKDYFANPYMVHI